MSTFLRKRVSMLLLLAVGLTCFSGCGLSAPADTVTETTVFSQVATTSFSQGETEESSVPVTEETAATTTAGTGSGTETGSGTPIRYTWNPHVISQLNLSVMEDDAEAVFFAWIDAMIQGEESVKCPSEALMWELNDRMNIFFPPFHMLVASYSYADGEIVMQLQGDADSRKELLTDFAGQLSYLIQLAGVCAEDSETLRAIKLYRMYSGIVAYDYEGMETEEIVDLSSYRAIMDLEGICQSFAAAYAYLCLQVGVEATTVSGMTEVFSAHEWALLQLDGSYYHVDPTFENGDGGGAGLKYFGMTSAQRELAGGFVAADYNIGNSNAIWGRDFDLSDARFEALWEASYVWYVLREGGATTLVCERADGSEFEFAVDGK